MYKVVRKSKKLPDVLKNVFSSYDAARTAVRKWILYRLYLRGFVNKRYRSETEWFNRTVNIGKFGFSITRVIH